MKKLLFLVAVVAASFTANAQGQFNAGVNLGLPVGDASNVSSFAFGVEANYLFEVSDEFKVGPTASYVHFLGKDGLDAPSFLPLGGAARYSVSDEFVVGADLGLALGMANASGSSFFYRPMVGYNISETMMVQASYMGMSVDSGLGGSSTFATFSAGLMFAL
ncbi:outer membrane beta-barrel protein [Tenacibaculum soleae]|uniref:outer membrane beta-barrel protein n=1 Tax=Tenacibaculum soleae TaxID=447689 RepID=UPI0026E41F3E|nr:outer membrane beta-barrel protein [Tenacibaculum soleae]MDO6812424.1 outer membrane beta-barrel protein [Tenacibaculum soleae]